MTINAAIRIEGGLLSPDLLEQLAAGTLPGQRAVDFGLPATRSLTDAIADALTDAHDLWTVFQRRLSRLPTTDPATALTRDAWVIPFFSLLGYELTAQPQPIDIGGMVFAISHRADRDPDAPPVHLIGARRELGRVDPTSRPRLAPHVLLQEYLNRSDQLWGIVTNGLTIRLLRSSTFIRRQSYVEIDLATIVAEQRFPEFALLYRLLHRSRLPHYSAARGAEACWLEQYYQHAVDQGGRVRDRLRDSVEQAIICLATGFLTHRANADLRALAAADLHQQALRLVYHLLFLLVAESRGLLSSHPVYHEHYSITRLRRLCERRAAYTDHDDLWHSLRALWITLSDERMAPLLDLAPLNGDLFAPQPLDAAIISNRDLLTAIWHLSMFDDPPQRVNYAALDTEELGSVYESLLDLHPVIEEDASGRLTFAFHAGAERKTTGSYYTPPALVAELIQTTLDPVIAATLDGLRRAGASAATLEQALLSITVCDPACGSGHFLLAAARRLGKELARIRTGEEEPAPDRQREATRAVISHCLYGVDANPLAVELCRVALWLEGHTPGKPLTFLDHRIRCGDSLVGVFDLSTLAQGIPDAAFAPLAGDDPAVARQAKRQNAAERRGQRSLFAWDATTTLAQLSRVGRELAAIGDDTPAQVREKRQRLRAVQEDPAWTRQREACDLWTAAFFQRFTPTRPVITSAAVEDRLANQPVLPTTQREATAIAERTRCFHWPLAFPEVFAAGGFAVVLGNPPWERIKLQEQEFFAARDARIATAPTKAERGRRIRELPQTNPTLYAAYQEALRTAEGVSRFLRHSERFPLTGRGDINTYAVFAELCRALLRPGGRAGIIVPTGIATDDTTSAFFHDLMQSGALVALYDFENRKGIFPAVHRSYKFCLLTIQRAQATDGRAPATFVFFAQTPADLRQPEKRCALSADDLALLNPNTRTCPIFRTQADAELTKAIYRRVPVVWREARDGQPEANPWRLSFSRMFDMANDSHLFRAARELLAAGYRREGNRFVGETERYLPLYEAKLLHQFDHRWATYDDAGEAREVTEAEKRDPTFVAQPRYWVAATDVAARLPQEPAPLAEAARRAHLPSIRRVLLLWAAGCHLAAGNALAARHLLEEALLLPLERAVARELGEGTAREQALRLASAFPLEATDLARIEAGDADLPTLAADLLARFSPRWLMGWRDITNATNERTLIATALPLVGVGHKFLLLFSRRPCNEWLLLLATLNSFVADYCARQKLGGTSLTYFTLRQIAILPPSIFAQSLPFTGQQSLADWIASRALELLYTAEDMAPLARDLGYDGPPFPWDAERRFAIRCELDAAFFHLYLPATADGRWRPARIAGGHVVDEMEAELAALTAHFPTPRDAVSYILDQFPIARRKDEARYGRYRTKEEILARYDAMQATFARRAPDNGS